MTTINISFGPFEDAELAGLASALGMPPDGSVAPIDFLKAAINNSVSTSISTAARNTAMQIQMELNNKAAEAAKQASDAALQVVTDKLSVSTDAS